MGADSGYDSRAFLDELTRIVSRAGGALLRACDVALRIREKADTSPVTTADEAAEAVILEGLRHLDPGLGVLSEEAFASGTRCVPGRFFALVDPLDGTRELIAGRDEFTVNVALVKDGRAHIGVIGAPARGVIWRGVVGHGAERVHLAAGDDLTRQTPIVPVRARAVRHPAVALVSRSHPDPRTQAFLRSFANITCQACGSSLKFALLAEGQADVYPRLAPTREWDICAGEAVLTAAGGLVRTPEGEPVTYGRLDRELLVPSFIAWGDPKQAAPQD